MKTNVFLVLLGAGCLPVGSGDGSGDLGQAHRRFICRPTAVPGCSDHVWTAQCGPDDVIQVEYTECRSIQGEWVTYRWSASAPPNGCQAAERMVAAWDIYADALHGVCE